MEAMIDLRSDTVTRPTPGMREAMMQAPVGDDGYGDDESVNGLQEKAAALFGLEAALFCPSGTMTNQIGIRIHTQPGDEVICDQLAHVYLSEGGGIAVHSGSSVRCLPGDRGRFTAEQVRENINQRDAAGCPYSRLVVIENTVNHGGGSCWDLAEIRRIRQVGNEQGLALHLDGARLFNALVARGETPRQYGELFDTISICLSKGLGAPAGSLLLGSREKIQQAHRQRKVLGGGMRQAGFLAAAGSYALDHQVNRLRDDQAKAQALARELPALPFVSSFLPVETNIVIFQLAPGINTAKFLAYLEQRNIRAPSIRPQTIRLVFHLDVSDSQFDSFLETLRAFIP
jgi:threonine aldolase